MIDLEPFMNRLTFFKHLAAAFLCGQLALKLGAEIPKVEYPRLEGWEYEMRPIAPPELPGGYEWVSYTFPAVLEAQP